MQLFIDLDLREAVNSPGDRSLISAIQCSSQDTLEQDVYFVRNGNIVNPGAGVALKFGLFPAGQTTAVALQTGYTQQTDSSGNVYWSGLVDFNTSQMVTALGSASNLICNGQLRYQLADGEIIHSIYLPFVIFPALLQETGTPPPAPANTYPDVTTLVLVSQKGAPGGVAELTGAGLMNPAEFPIDGQTVVLTAGKLSVPIDNLSLTLQGGKLAVSIDGKTIVLAGGVLQSGLILTSFTANWATPNAGFDVAVQVNDSSKLKTGQSILVPLAGYYKVKTITDLNNVTITNGGDPFNTGAGVSILAGTPILPAQLLGSGSGSISLAIGTVTTLTAGTPATASITGSAPAFTLNLGIPQGPAGTTPANPTLAIGSVSTLPAGSAATASISGTYPNFSLNLGIPQGAAGGGGTGGTGLTTLTDAETTTGISVIYDGPTGKLMRLAFDPLFNVSNQGTYWQIPFPAFPRTDAAFTIPAVGSNTPSLAVENQGTQFLQAGLQVYISGAGLFSVVSTGSQSAVFQNLGSQQGFTNAAPGGTISAGAWIAIIPSPNLTDAETTEGFSLIANGPQGIVKRLLIPAWLQPVDTGQEIKITAPTPAGVGDMKAAVYDTLTTLKTATPAGQVDLARFIIRPPLAMMRNWIHNGSFQVAQRGASFGSASGFQLDRWQTLLGNAPTAVVSLTQTRYLQANVFPVNSPSGPNENISDFFSAKFVVTTAGTMGASQYIVFQHALESPDYANFDSPTVFVPVWRFWARSSIAGAVLGYSLGWGGTGGNQSSITYAGLTMPNANSWYEGIIVGGNFQNNNIFNPGTAAATLRFALGTGSSCKVPAGNLGVPTASSTLFASTTATDFVNTLNATVEIANVSLVPAYVNSPQPANYANPSFEEDLRRCERFYCKSYPYGTQAGAVGNGNLGAFYCGATNAAYGNVRFPVDMGGVPTVRVFDPINGGASGSGFTGSATITGLTPTWIAEKGFSNIGGSGFVVGNVLLVGWDASKEI